MKKILFLLLCTVSFYGQTYQNPTFGIVKTMTAPTVTTTPHLGTVEAGGTISKITPENLPLSTATTNALELETDVSAGAIIGFALTNNGDGTVNIASGTAYLRSTNDPYSTIIKYPISSVTNLALTDNANNFVLVDYNSGSPTLTVTTNSSTINTQTNSLCYIISRVGNTLDYLSLVGQNVDPNAKLRIRFLNQEGIRRASGAVLGSSSRNLTLTSSVLFSGLIRINAVAFNTASPDTFTLAYNNGSTWTRTTGQTQINNTQYNVSGTLTTMPNNTFRTDYVYLLPNNPSKLYVIMGTTTYGSLTLAKGAPRPSALPVELQVLGLEVGRLFIEKNNASIAEVQSSFANDFVGAAVPEHNSLTGLQGGTSGEYNHLTNAQVTLVNGAEQADNKATDFTTVNNTLYPTVQATKTYADGLVVGLLNDRGSYDASGNLYPSTGGSGTAGAIKKGNLWAISVAGTLGGVPVGIGDWLRALVDTPAQTAANWSVVEGNFGYVPENVANKSDSYTASSSTTYASTKAIVDGLVTKQNALTNPVTGTASVGQVAFWNSSSEIKGFGSFTWDDTTKRLGVGIGVPLYKADVIGSSTYQARFALAETAYADGGILIGSKNGSDPHYFGELLWNQSTQSLSLNAESGILTFGTSINGVAASEKASISMSGVFKINNLSGSGERVISADGSGNLLISSAPTAPTASAGSTGTQVANCAFVNTAIGNYKKYVALMSQSGTSAPTATVLENTFSGTPAWTRTSSGSYVGTLAGAFVTNKTVIFVNNSDAAFGYGVTLNTGDGTIHWENGADGRMNNTGTMIEIRVYNLIFLLPYSMIRRRRKKLIKNK